MRKELLIAGFVAGTAIELAFGAYQLGEIHATKVEEEQLADKLKQLDQRVVVIQTHEAEDRSSISDILKTPTLQKDQMTQCIIFRARFYPGEEDHKSQCQTQ